MVILTALMMLLPLVSLGQNTEKFEELNGTVIASKFDSNFKCDFSIFYNTFPGYNVDLQKSSVSCSPKKSKKVKGYNISSELGSYFFTLDFNLKKGKGKFSKATIHPDTATGPENSENTKFFDNVALSHPGCLFCLTKNALMCIPTCFPEQPPTCLACIVKNALTCLTPCGFSKIHQQLEGKSVAENGTEIIMEKEPPFPGSCSAQLDWFSCEMEYNHCNKAEGYNAANWYDSAKVRCCCKCCTSKGSCGTTTC